MAPQLDALLVLEPTQSSGWRAEAKSRRARFLPLVRRDALQRILYGSEPCLSRPEETSMESRCIGPRGGVFSPLAPSSALAKRCTAASLRIARSSDLYNGRERPIPPIRRLVRLIPSRTP